MTIDVKRWEHPGVVKESVSDGGWVPLEQGGASKADTDLENIKCEHCTKTFHSIAGKRTHINSVHLKVEYQCRLCPKKFNWQSQLCRHVNAVHKRKSYPCTICNKVYTRNDTLSEHYQLKHLLNAHPYQDPMI